jgi:hypothetical protein
LGATCKTAPTFISSSSGWIVSEAIKKGCFPISKKDCFLSYKKAKLNKLNTIKKGTAGIRSAIKSPYVRTAESTVIPGARSGLAELYTICANLIMKKCGLCIYL